MNNKNIQIQLIEEPLVLSECVNFVSSDGVGGIVNFVGTVRNQTKGKTVLRLDFEAYEPMAVSEMRKIAEKALEKFDVQKIAIHHRIGFLKISEVPVNISNA